VHVIQNWALTAKLPHGWCPQFSPPKFVFPSKAALVKRKFEIWSLGDTYVGKAVDRLDDCIYNNPVGMPEENPFPGLRNGE
jgi:hypothetical protein